MLKAKPEAVRVGGPLDLVPEVGPLATRRQRDRDVSLAERSIAAGAKLLTDGRAS
ncbi:aldehyde dehydrogenase family protein [Mesorhizobium sp. KR1-2]|uniref:aldehyde dehydrogenase family protein n=1 Tax=Mesorhizobium sp. KR1-2 TaxID=3156609 RepID=UPI0032B38EE5